MEAFEGQYTSYVLHASVYFSSDHIDSSVVWLVTNELDRMRKEAVVAYFMVLFWTAFAM
jgi:hypothetical protein